MASGPARTFTLVFGTAYILVALAESLLSLAGHGRLVVGGVTLLAFSLVHNMVHWGLGLGLLAARYFGRYPARLASGIVGGILVALSLVGLLTPSALNRMMGVTAVPAAYTVVYALTAIFGLVAAFTSNAEPGMTRRNVRYA